MADTNSTKTPNTDTMQREQAPAGTAGDRKPEDRKPEQGERSTQEKSAIGGGEAKSPTGESPVGHSGQSGAQTPTGQNREPDKKLTEPTSR